MLWLSMKAVLEKFVFHKWFHAFYIGFGILLFVALWWWHYDKDLNGFQSFWASLEFGVFIALVLVGTFYLGFWYAFSSWRRQSSPAAKIFEDPGTVLLALVGMAATVIFGWLSYQSSRQTSQMALRNELYGNERWWYDACSEHAHLYAWVAQVKPETTPPEYVRLCLQATSKGVTFVPKTVQELKVYLWDADQFHVDVEHKARLRRQYDVMDLVFYHLERVHSYTSSDFRPMSKAEANTWLGLLKNVGPNPLLLVSIMDAHEYGYISPEFAKWVQNTFREHKDAAVVAYFYPHLLEDSWLSDVEAKQKALAFYEPKPADNWEKKTEERMAAAGLPWKRPGQTAQPLSAPQMARPPVPVPNSKATPAAPPPPSLPPRPFLPDLQSPAVPRPISPDLRPGR